MKKTISWILFFCFAILSTGCSPNDEVIKGRGETMAAYTMVAVLTQSAFETVAAKLTEVSSLVTPQPNLTETQMAATLMSGSQTPTINVTPSPVSALSSNLTPAVAAGTACNQAQYISDVNVPDDTGFNANDKFTKTWRIKNIGTCTWNSGYKLIYSGGAELSASKEVPQNITVAPGATVDVSVPNMVAPNLAGTYVSYWMLQSSDNKVFGVSVNGKSANLYVRIKVGSGTSNANTAYYLEPNACTAGWFTSSGTISCPSSNATNGGVSPMNSIVVEGGYTKGPVIVMIPPATKGGKISGQFPSYQVQPNDHFTAQVGCVDGFPNCDLTFQITYVGNDGSSHNCFGPKGQTEDAYVDPVDCDLSTMAGSTIQMILTVTNNAGNSDDHGFIQSPIIQP